MIQSFYILIVFLSFFNLSYTPLSASHFECVAYEDVQNLEKKNDAVIKKYLLPKNSQLAIILKNLITDPTMFDSNQNFQNAGFLVKNGHRNLMVGMHPSTPNYLIKKFSSVRSQKMQIDNFIKRIKGAEKVRNYIKKNKFKHLIVPKKWLFKLPSAFSDKKEDPSYLLIVENMDILQDWIDPNSQARQLYYNMDKEILTELCKTLHAIGGCDAFPRNQPFTKTGKIAFVDTEHVGHKKGHFIKHIVPALNPELQAYALALWSKLEEENKKEIIQNQ